LGGIAISILRFYWSCIAWAATGTLEKANAWFWPVGVPLVALAGWHWGVGTLAIPDNLQDFFVFMVLTVAVSWVVFFAIRLLGAPHHLVKVIEQERDDLNQRLKALGQERPLSFNNVQFKTYVNKKTRKCNITAVVYFANHGERMLKWRLLSYSIEANGKKLTSPTATTNYFVNRGQQCWYNYPTLQDVPFNGWPITVDIMFDCEYDNVPPLVDRGTKRLNRYVLPAAVAQNLMSSDLIAEER
jgi:hypothetical protein